VEAAIDRHARSRLDNGFESPPSRCFGNAGGNVNDVSRLQIDIRRFCGQDLLERDDCRLWAAFRSLFADQLRLVERGVGAGALRHRVSLENSHVRILHDEAAGQANLSNDVYDSRFRDHNGVAGIHIDVALAGRLAIVGESYGFRPCGAGAMQKRHGVASPGSGSASG